MSISGIANRHLGVVDPAKLDPEHVLDTPAIDAILKIQPSGSNALITQVVATFSDATQDLVGQLRQLYEPHEIILKTPPLAHKLKGSAMVTGAKQLIRIAAELESATRNATGEVTQDYIAAKCDECELELRDYIALMESRYL
ncbi:MAG: Hpt domain-containing protein [Pseudomonadota bacterium]